MKTKQDKNLHLLIMFFSSITVLVGVYEIFTGGTFSDYFSTILLGVSLFGVGFINYQGARDNENI